MLTCVDARVAPSHFAGLELGDVLVMRNVGGRVTDTVGLEMSILWTLMTMAAGKEPHMELAIVHHTSCGMERFSDPTVAAKVTEKFGISSIVATYAIEEPHLSVATDIERLRNDERVPGGLNVSGHVYDIATGRLSTVVETVRLR